MKKVLAVVLALIVGLLANAAICTLGVFLWVEITFLGYVLLVIIPMFAYAAFLDFLADRTVVKRALSPRRFFLWVQVPPVFVAIVNIIKCLIVCRRVGGGFSGLVPTLNLFAAWIIFVTVVLTTASVFVTAHFQRKGIRQ